MPRPRFHKLDPDKRDRILTAALVEFGDNGFERASMNRILAACDLSKGAAYYYFDGKQDLFNTVVEHAFDRVMSAFGGALVPIDPARDFWTQLDELGQRLIRKMLDDPELAALARSMGNMREPGVMSQAVATLYDRANAMIGAMIEVGQAHGAIRRDLPFALVVRLVVAIFAEVDRWILEHLDEMDDAGLAEASALAVDLARRVVGSRSEP